MPIDGAGRFTIATGRNDGLGASFFNALNQGLAVIPLVCNHSTGTNPRDQCRALRDIGHLPCAQDEADRIAQSIHASVNLGGQPTPASPDGLVLMRTVFFSSPCGVLMGTDNCGVDEQLFKIGLALKCRGNSVPDAVAFPASESNIG